MRGITGGGDDLNIIPSMDATTPVDVDLLADEVPPPCRFLFAETATFGSDLADFHKTTYQDPPVGGLISQGAAVYRDPQSARTRSTSWPGHRGLRADVVRPDVCRRGHRQEPTH